MEYENSCYVYVDKLFTFQEARSYCQGFLGKNAEVLYDIKDPDSNRYILNLVSKEAAFFKTGKLWLGLEILGLNNESRWIKHDSGASSRDYRNWVHENSPQNQFRRQCTIMLNNGEWTNNGCYEHLPFVCKKSKNFLVVLR